MHVYGVPKRVIQPPVSVSQPGSQELVPHAINVLSNLDKVTVMRFSAALLVGLGARIFLDIIIRPPPELSRRDAILTGIWQGVALYHTYFHHLEFLFLVSFAISAWLMIDFALIHDVNRMTTILLGVALGIFCAGLLSQFEGDHRSGKRQDALAQSPSKKNRLAQAYKDTRGERSRRPRVPAMSDITAPSLDTSSDTLDSKFNMTPVEREIASLRTRASLADTERRRYREEKKWALSQGNIARAEQMRWQVKRYTTLVHSFNREANALLQEGAKDTVITWALKSQ
jgi:hypothetical protein